MEDNENQQEEQDVTLEKLSNQKDDLGDLPPEVIQVISELREFSIESERSGFSVEESVFSKIDSSHITKVLDIRLEQIKQEKENAASIRDFYFKSLISILFFLLITTLFLGYQDVSAFIELVKLAGQAIALIFGGIGIKSLFDKSQK